jgi:hypothetical protein
MRIGEYGNRRRATLPYPVYVTNSKHWSPGVRDLTAEKSRPTESLAQARVMSIEGDQTNGGTTQS